MIAHLNLFMEIVRGKHKDLSPDDRAALCLGRPQLSTLQWMDEKQRGLMLSISCQRRLRRKLIQMTDRTTYVDGTISMVEAVLPGT